jgi:hypothetical protein
MLFAITPTVRRFGWLAALALGAVHAGANPPPQSGTEVPREIPITDSAGQYRLQRLYVKQRFDSPVAMAVMPLPEPRHAIM